MKTRSLDREPSSFRFSDSDFAFLKGRGIRGNDIKRLGAIADHCLGVTLYWLHGNDDPRFAGIILNFTASTLKLLRVATYTRSDTGSDVSYRPGSLHPFVSWRLRCYLLVGGS